MEENMDNNILTYPEGWEKFKQALDFLPEDDAAREAFAKGMLILAVTS